jgi:hypothetical protein
MVLFFCEFNNIEYLVLWYLNTGSFEKWAEEPLHDGEVQSSFTSGMAIEGDLI